MDAQPQHARQQARRLGTTQGATPAAFEPCPQLAGLTLACLRVRLAHLRLLDLALVPVGAPALRGKPASASRANSNECSGLLRPRHYAACPRPSWAGTTVKSYLSSQTVSKRTTS